MTSVAVNCAIIFYTSNALSYILAGYQLDLLHQFMIIVAIEHLVIIYKFLYSVVIKDKPSWVCREEKENSESQHLLYTVLDNMKTEYKAAGNEPIEDQISYIQI